MKKTLAVVFAVLVVALLVSSVAVAQQWQWQFSRLVPAAGDTTMIGNVHGLAVSPDGKIWIVQYGILKGDSVTVPDYLLKYAAGGPNAGKDSLYVTRTIGVRALYVYNPDGTKPSWSPIKYLTGARTDTLGFDRMADTLAPYKLRFDPVNSVNSGRGLRKAHDGNILAVYWGNVFKIDYKTGAGLKRLTHDVKNSDISPGVDALGEVFIANVAPGNPLKIYDANFAYLGNVVDTTKGYSRTMEVSSDGNDVYWAGYTNNAIYKYHSDNGSLGPYTLADTILKGFACESMTWGTKTNQQYLWASAGSYNGKAANLFPGVTTSYTTGAWYGYDVSSKTIKDSLIWTFKTAKSNAEEPRGIAFSPTGDTCYVGTYGSGSAPGVRMYLRVITAVEKIGNILPSEYTLEQNYPNPFNPSTEIKFTIAKTGATALVVYDMLGREIAVLMYETLQPGTYKYRFDGSSFASGTYFYELRSGDTRLVKKMMLVK
jgi:hypothetical protein